MNKSFISNSYFYGILFIVIFSFLLGFFQFSFVIAFLSGILFWLFRKKVNFYTFNTRDKLNIFSPVCGEIKKIIKNESENVLIISVGFFDNYGVYLPNTSRVDNFEVKGGDQFFRYKIPNDLLEFEKYRHISIALRGKNGAVLKMEFYKNFLGKKLKSWLLPGDRGKQKANMGFLPFGGTVLLYLPKNCEILTNIGEKVIGGETLLAINNK